MNFANVLRARAAGHRTQPEQPTALRQRARNYTRKGRSNAGARAERRDKRSKAEHTGRVGITMRLRWGTKRADVCMYVSCVCVCVRLSVTQDQSVYLN